MNNFKLRETEAGELLHEEKFYGTELEAERLQATRWNDNYAMGEPRVSSRLYKLHSERTPNGWVSRWRRFMSLGV